MQTKFSVLILISTTVTLVLTSCFEDCPQRIFSSEEIGQIIEKGGGSHNQVIEAINLTDFEQITGDNLSVFLDILETKKIIRENAALQVYVNTSKTCGTKGQILVFIANAGEEGAKFNHIMILNEKESTHEAQLDALAEVEAVLERQAILRLTSSSIKDAKAHTYLNYNLPGRPEFDQFRYFSIPNRGTAMSFYVKAELPHYPGGFEDIDFYVINIRLPHEEGAMIQPLAQELRNKEAVSIAITDYIAEFYNCKASDCIAKFLDRKMFLRTSHRGMLGDKEEHFFMPLPNVVSFGKKPLNLQFEILVSPEEPTRVWLRTFDKPTAREVFDDLMASGYNVDPQFTEDGLEELFTHEYPGRPDMTFKQFDKYGLYYSAE